jgi:hypothetical protein
MHDIVFVTYFMLLNVYFFHNGISCYLWAQNSFRNGIFLFEKFEVKHLNDDDAI